MLFDDFRGHEQHDNGATAAYLFTVPQSDR
jgi:hypothetical protein